MKRFLIVLMLFGASSTYGAGMLPEIYVNEIPNNLGGSYFVAINQPTPRPPEPTWALLGWGIINQDATSVSTGRSGWDAALVDKASWDSGLVFEQNPFGFEDPYLIFGTGSEGIGEFDEVFGPGFSQAAVYWLSEYFGMGLTAATQNFDWQDGVGNSTAFAIITGIVDLSPTTLACSIPVNPGTPTPGVVTNCAPVGAPAIPLPAAAWLFGSALGLLGWLKRPRPIAAT